MYWKPLYNLLEDQYTVLVVNAQHVKAVPGRKTDVKDAEWLADLLRHGLLTASFIPSRAQRELRELTRYRTSLVQERSAEVARLYKVLEGANIKLASVASDLMGVSAQAMLRALVQGETDATTLAGYARGRLREKQPALTQALAGSVGPHQRFLLAQQLAHLEALDALIAAVSAQIAEDERPFQAAVTVLDTIPGVGRRTAEVIVAEMGTDMTRFPTAGHLASWAGLCPGNHESAGKQHSGAIRTGNTALRTALVEAAQAAGATKHSYLAAQYHRLAARRGSKRAAVAVAHSILVIAYHLLSQSTPYTDLGANYFDEHHKHDVERRLVKRLEHLGFRVTIEATNPAA